jgi:hypothetical protein
MTDNLNPTQDSSTETENTERMIPKGRFNEVNEENKTLKARLKAIEDKQAEDNAARLEQQQKEMAEQNRYKELYEAAQAQLATLQAAQNEAKLYRDSLENTLKARIESIPEDKRHLIPDFGDITQKMAYLDKAFPDLVAPQKPNAPRLDGGSGSAANRNSSKLTDTEIQFATEAGISLEAYAKQKEARGKPLDLSKQE